jgi:hypothetical protein
MKVSKTFRPGPNPGGPAQNMGETVKIDPVAYGVDVRRLPVEAAESEVYEGYESEGRKVAFKVYRSLSAEQVLLYAEVTNFLAGLHNDSDDYIKLEVGGGVLSLRLHIVPIDVVGMVGNRPCTISPFIEGETLFDLEPHYMSSRFIRLKDDPLVRLSGQLAREAGRRNIAIIPWNVKPLLDQKVLAITDICGSIRELR